jgi:hypothetical protein
MGDIDVDDLYVASKCAAPTVSQFALGNADSLIARVSILTPHYPWR